MSRTPKPDTVQLPADVSDVAAWRALFSVPIPVHESVVALLAERGKLYSIYGGKPNLAGQADYLRTLSEFCSRVPDAAAGLAQQRANNRQRDTLRRKQEERHLIAELPHVRKAREEGGR